jgi:pimeloyl-ACP methyl ester carboxylesterase
LKRLVYFAVPLFAVVLLSHFYVPLFIIEIKNPLIEYVQSERYVDPELYTSSPKRGKFSVSTSDGIVLSGYFTFTQTDSVCGTVILLHGLRSGKEHLFPLANFLASEGFQSLALDLRAHGSSTGLFCTFGVKEKHDISEVIDLLEKEGMLRGDLIVWGQSLGAAVGLQTMAIDKRIDYGVFESTFSEFRITAHDYFQFHLGFNIPLFTDYLIDRAGVIGDFDPDLSSPRNACLKISKPVIMVHGNEDKRIDISYGLQNYQQLSSRDKKFLALDGAAHLDAWKTGGIPYFKEALRFIEE